MENCCAHTLMCTKKDLHSRTQLWQHVVCCPVPSLLQAQPGRSQTKHHQHLHKMHASDAQRPGWVRAEAVSCLQTDLSLANGCQQKMILGFLTCLHAVLAD